MRLKELRARSIRGLPRSAAPIAFANRGLVVYGPNGVGKSSIVDALEVCLQGRSTLFAENRTGVSWDTASPHVVDGTPDVGITITDGSSTHVVPSADGAPLPPDAQAWVSAARGASLVLRRHALLRFVSAAPAVRYAELSRFLNLGPCTTIEARLKALVEKLDSEIGTSLLRLGQLREQARAVFGLAPEAPVNRAALLCLASAKLELAGLATCPSVDAAATSLVRIESALSTGIGSERVAELVALRSAAAALDVDASLAPACKAAAAAAREVIAARTGAPDAATNTLVLAGLVLLRRDQPGTCPLCEQPIALGALVSRLSHASAGAARLGDATSALATAAAALRDLVDPLTKGFKDVSDAWRKTVAQPLPESYASGQEWLSDVALELKRAPSDPAALCDAIGALPSSWGLALLRGDVDACLAKEGGAEHITALLSAKQMLSFLKGDLAGLEACEGAVGRRNAQRALLQRVLLHVEAARKAAVAQVLASVATIANEIYEDMHPDEAIGSASLSVRQNVAASVELSAQFHGAEESPLLHFSESHLDTLGLAFFLALRRYEADRQPQVKVLALDDVIHSVDADHRVRFVQVLSRRFADHQILLTTHDPILYDRLRESIGADNATFLRLERWSLADGPVAVSPLVERDIVMSVSSLGHQDVAAAAGRFFEALARELCERLRAPVLLKPRYTIRDLWEPLLRQLRKQKAFAAQHGKEMDDLQNNAWVRNESGAHSNPTPSPVTPAEVEGLRAGLAQLYRAVWCATCVEFIRAEGATWRCSDGHIEYA